MSIKPIAIIEHDPVAPAGTILDWLAEAGYPTEVIRPHAGDELPTDLGDYAGMIMLGGGQSARSDRKFEWRSQTVDLVQRAAAVQFPSLGMCLSSQVFAHALGGVVDKGEHGMEIGAMQAGRKDVSYQDELFDTLPMAPDVIEFHGEVISELPPDAVLLMGGPLYENQAFRVGKNIWAIQFHIETTPEIFGSWIRDNEEALRRKGFDTDRILERYELVHPDLEEVWAPFIRKFAEIATGTAR